jgi:glycosyltransferase involved in cell wall biosynthesis
MKILFISTFFGKKLGGAEVSANFLFAGLKKINEIHLVTAQKLIENNIHSLHLSLVPKKVFIAGNHWLDKYISFKLVKLIKKLLPDILHVQDLFILPATVIIAKRLRLPVVITVRDNLPRYFPFFNFIFKFRNNHYLEALKRCDAVIAISHSIRNNLIEFGVPAEKITTIYNICPKLISDKTKTDNTNFIILGLGRMCEEKGFDILIKSVVDVKARYQIKNIKLRLIGNGPERKKLERIAMKLGLKDSFEFISWVDNKNIADEYSQSDILVVPSRYEEPLGRVVLEASSCSKPVIASNVGGLKEIIQDGFNGLLVPPDDYISLSQSIFRLYHDASLRQYLGSNAKRSVLEKFSESTIVRQTINLYEKIKY